MSRHVMHFSLVLLAAPITAQTVQLPLTPSEWSATDSIRFSEYLGRPALYINSGVAMSKSAAFRNGAIDFDMVATTSSSNLGVAFHARASDAFEVVFFRPGATGTDQAMQYAPAINSIGASWQVAHGPGANAAIAIPRQEWIHVRLQVMGDSTDVFVGDMKRPALSIPHLLLGGEGNRIALWASAFGHGAWYSNISYTPDSRNYAPSPAVAPSGTVMSWELSPLYEATDLHPGVLPDLRNVKWERVTSEPAGYVWINRYRQSPQFTAPALHDSVLHNRVARSKVVLARTIIDSPTARTQLLHFGFSDNVVVYCNGQPLYQGINPYGFNDLGHYDPDGHAVFLPLKAGRNEIVFAVTDFFGGWVVSARMER